MKSVMKHDFSEVPRAEIPRSQFNRSHGHKTTFDAGWLVPIYLDEVLPGDTFKMNMTGFARMATPIKPVMDNLFMETFFFFVPNRILWTNWERFMGEENSPNEQIEFFVPTMELSVADQAAEGYTNSLYNYMGVHTAGIDDCRFISLPFRAYNLIWNDWFRDQNLQNKKSTATGNDDDVIGFYQLLRRGKRHDYFTSCLPFPQKGEEVTIPTLDSAPVVGAGSPTFQDDGAFQLGALQAEATANAKFTNAPGAVTTAIWSDPALTVDLSQATAVSINDLRVSFQLQKLLERNARGGTRYPELIHAHFGVTTPDYRVMRPEFLGGGSSRINVNQVEQTGQTSVDSPQGNLAAYGTANLINHGFTKSFTEHGWVIGLVNVRADLTYQDVFERHWLRHTKYEFYWPALAHIGEQAVYEFEIYPSGNLTWPGWGDLAAAVGQDGIAEKRSVQAIIGDIQADAPFTADGQTNEDDPGQQDYEVPAGTFGYQERYAEYRYKPSRISGAFNSRHPQPLDVWHLAQEFTAQPKLGAGFITDEPPIDRVVAIPSEPDFIADFYFNLQCARPMPLNGTPGYIDRF